MNMREHTGSTPSVIMSTGLGVGFKRKGKKGRDYNNILIWLKFIVP